jgi:hypothetical protein
MHEYRGPSWPSVFWLSGELRTRKHQDQHKQLAPGWAAALYVLRPFVRGANESSSSEHDAFTTSDASTFAAGDIDMI